MIFTTILLFTLGFLILILGIALYSMIKFLKPLHLVNKEELRNNKQNYDDYVALHHKMSHPIIFRKTFKYRSEYGYPIDQFIQEAKFSLIKDLLEKDDQQNSILFKVEKRGFEFGNLNPEKEIEIKMILINPNEFFNKSINYGETR